MIMANLNDLDDDEFGLENNQDDQTNVVDNGSNANLGDSTSQEPIVEDHDDDLLDGTNSRDNEDDILSSLLKSKGINPDSVKFENERGELEERNFFDLPKDEQLELLKYDKSNDEYSLDDSEISLINELRTGNLTPNEYKQYLQQKAIQDYLQSSGEEPQMNTTIDSLSNEELFLADLKSKIPDITDEEALAKLDSEKLNEDLFTKEVGGLREHYRQMEQAQIEAEQQETARQRQQEEQEFANTIIDAIGNNSSIDIGDTILDLSDTEKNEIASFILESDAAGVRHIAKALNDPQTLVGMSWYALHGQEAFHQLSDYYRQKISEAAKNNYSKGWNDAKNGRNPSKTIVRKTNRTNNNKPMSINDID